MFEVASAARPGARTCVFVTLFISISIVSVHARGAGKGLGSVSDDPALDPCTFRLRKSNVKTICPYPSNPPLGLDITQDNGKLGFIKVATIYAHFLACRTPLHL